MRNFAFARPLGPLVENAVDIFPLRDYSFGNFPSSCLVLLFVLSTMMCLMLV